MDQALDRIDTESQSFLSLLEQQERMRSARVPGVRTVLVVLSSRGMVYDMDSLRQKILLTYPDATVFFRTTQGDPIGSSVSHAVDLLIDFTGPGQRQGWFYSRKLRRHARVAVGRNAGFFRKGIYDRIFDEKSKNSGISAEVMLDPLARERAIQKAVLALVGVSLTQAGDTLPDLSASIALELPPLARR